MPELQKASLSTPRPCKLPYCLSTVTNKEYLSGEALELTESRRSCFQDTYDQARGGLEETNSNNVRQNRCCSWASANDEWRQGTQAHVPKRDNTLHAYRTQDKELRRTFWNTNT